MTEINKDALAADTHALDAFNRRIVEEFRANQGRVQGVPGDAVLLLHTIGAKSGQPRLSPLAYLQVEGRLLVAGSSMGSDKDPAWVHNLRANARASIEIGTEHYDVVAREVTGDQRDALFATFAQRAPVLADHQRHTDRVIPLFELVRS
ncbi:nitroreductase/quinone reductase family protein [Mycolicibacterium stellerae]|uniref:nitroreductase/quinone reductase family protein n=1 Tax=Mycolicibacterium stellerae TaxID=2358193 RepID=UPI000F0BA0D5|nr:nitroreductase/quinone reductase family protein [Mycolicibacterium stellerae]